MNLKYLNIVMSKLIYIYIIDCLSIIYINIYCYAYFENREFKKFNIKTKQI